MSLNDVINWVSDVVRQHEGWAIPIIFSWRSASRWRFVAAAAGHGDPAGAGRADRRKRHRLWPIWAAAAAGAFFGDWLSYWIGYHYQDRVAHMWPLSRNPQLLARGHAFFERWGVLGIFIGRFSARCAPWCRWWAAFAACRSVISS